MRKIVYLVILSALMALISVPAQSGTFSKTWTRYPIVLVPGVFDWDNLLGVDINYFYGIEEAIEKTSYTPNLFTQKPFHQKTHFIPLNPWQNTHDRAKDLKAKLETLMSDNGYKKVNIIAHSHGATTSRLAIRWMAMEAMDAGKSNPIASLTSIAGPHYGTPVADNYVENPNVALTTMLDLAGNFVVLLSGMNEYVGNQSSADVFKDFSQASIIEFNNKYPSAGLPAATGPYGSGGPKNGGFAGNGLGDPMDVDDPEAILYYSWTGNINDGWSTASDPADIIMLATNQMNLDYGFTGDADGFIPVTSARFGKVINDNFFWNHVDEMNHSLGIVNPDAASPKTIFRLHAQRLQKAGR